MNLPIMQSPAASQHFFLLRSKYSPQHPVPKHPQSIRPNFTVIQIYLDFQRGDGKTGVSELKGSKHFCSQFLWKCNFDWLHFFL